MTVGAMLLIAVAQQATLVGVVRDSVDLEPIAFAQVTVTPVGGEVVAGSGVSDRFGAFVVPGIAVGRPARVEVRAFGYAVWTRMYEAVPSNAVQVVLTPAPVILEGIDVTAGGRAGDPLSLAWDAFVIDTMVIRRLPTILETDVLRATAVSPSASAPSDYTSVPFIRGGTSDGTPVLLDGVRLFNAFHFGGFISAINPEVVKHATLVVGSGGDGLAIGSLSGAIDIATRDGSRDRMRMAGAVGLASSRLSVEGPVSEKVTYLLDGRRTYIDGSTLALKKLGVIDGHAPYFFHDVHAKVTADLDGVGRLSVSGYLNSESLHHVDARERVTRTTSTAWGNAAFSVHYRDKLGNMGIIDVNVGHSRFTSEMIRVVDNHIGVDDDGAVHDPPPETTLSGDGAMGESRVDLRVTRHRKHGTITMGTQATRFEVDHDFHYTNANFLDWDISSVLSRLTIRESRWRLAAYTSVEVPLQHGFSTRAGLRVDRFQGLATTLAHFGELSYRASWWGARISASRSHQALASLRNEEALLASYLAYDLLVPVSEAPVPRNSEFSIGWQGGWGGLRVRLDAYARSLDHLRLPDVDPNPIRTAVLGDPSLWRMASGKARGIEAFWSWMREGGPSILGSYRWASVSRTVGRRTYTPRFHRDHEFELSSSYNRGASLWSARVSLRSGQPTTPWLAVVPVTTYLGEKVVRMLLGGEYNSVKLPQYARIDVGWRRESEVSWFGGGSVVPYVSVANLFSLPNVVGWVPELLHRPEIKRTRVYRRQLPMIPFFGLEFRF